MLPTQDAGVVSRVTTAFGMALGAIARMQFLARSSFLRIE